MTIIDEKFIDELLSQARVSPRLRVRFDLRDSAQDGSQRLLNALVPGTQVPIHRHMETSETVFVLRGALEEVFYDEEVEESGRCLLSVRKGCTGCRYRRGCGTRSW